MGKLVIYLAVCAFHVLATSFAEELTYYYYYDELGNNVSSRTKATPAKRVITTTVPVKIGKKSLKDELPPPIDEDLPPTLPDPTNNFFEIWKGPRISEIPAFATPRYVSLHQATRKTTTRQVTNPPVFPTTSRARVKMPTFAPDEPVAVKTGREDLSDAIAVVAAGGKLIRNWQLQTQRPVFIEKTAMKSETTQEKPTVRTSRRPRPVTSPTTTTTTARAKFFDVWRGPQIKDLPLEPAPRFITFYQPSTATRTPKTTTTTRQRVRMPTFATDASDVVTPSTISGKLIKSGMSNHVTVPVTTRPPLTEKIQVKSETFTQPKIDDDYYDDDDLPPPIVETTKQTVATTTTNRRASTTGTTPKQEAWDLPPPLEDFLPLVPRRPLSIRQTTAAQPSTTRPRQATQRIPKAENYDLPVPIDEDLDDLPPPITSNPITTRLTTKMPTSTTKPSQKREDPIEARPLSSKETAKTSAPRSTTRVPKQEDPDLPPHLDETDDLPTPIDELPPPLPQSTEAGIPKISLTSKTEMDADLRPPIRENPATTANPDKHKPVCCGVFPKRASSTLLSLIKDGNENAALKLLQGNVDPYSEDINGRTALSEAARWGRVEVVRYLASNCCLEIDHRESDNSTALMIASRFNASREVIRILLFSGADPNLINDAGMTALMIAARNGLSESVKALLDFGAKPNLKDSEENTAIIYAAMANCRQCVMDLLTVGAFIDQQNKRKMTALMVAARSEFYELMLDLLRQKADTQIRDANGMRALQGLKYTPQLAQEVWYAVNSRHL